MSKKEKVYNISICLLALISVVFAVYDIWKGLSYAAKIVDWIIYLIFVADYFVRFFQARKKSSFFKDNILDLIAIIPFNSMFRIFRALKIARLARLAKMSKAVKAARFASVSARGARGLKRAHRFFNTNGLKYVIFLTIIAILGASIGMMYFEKMTFLDALWWSFVTATTVGYGDLSPVTGVGRVIAAILMIVGIGLISSLTSAITSFFINDTDETVEEEPISNDRVDMVVTLYKTLSLEEQTAFKKIIDKPRE